MSSEEAVAGPSKAKRMNTSDDTNSTEDNKMNEDHPQQEEPEGNNNPEGDVGDAEDDSDPAPLFTSQYQVVKTIFEYLNITDLLLASQTNRQWSDIGRIVRNQRKSKFYKILFHPFLPESKLAFEYFNQFCMDDYWGLRRNRIDVPEQARQLVEVDGVNGNTYRSGSDVNYPDFIVNATTHIKSSILEAYHETQMLIGFGTQAFDTYLKGERRHNRKSLCQRMKVIFGEIPERLPCFLSFSHGLVATPADSDATLELECRHLKFPCLNILAIPKVTGLRVNLFTVSKRQNLALEGHESAQQFKSLFEIGGETEANLKGILFLHKSTYRCIPIVESLNQYLRGNPEVALAGGIHDQILTSRNPDDRIISTGVLIYGDENVNVSTVLLTEADTDAQACREKLEKLKPTLVPDGSSFAFMFACNGRGAKFHGRPNVESEVFNSVFPGTPLLGAFTYGELCHEVTNPFNSDLPRATIQPPRNIRFQYTTVFLMVSYKHPEEDDTE